MLRRITHLGDNIDGRFILIAGRNDNGNALSSDFGKIFIISDINSKSFNRGIAISSTGQYLIRSGDAGVKVSSDYGNTWKLVIDTSYSYGVFARSCSISSSGQIQVATIFEQFDLTIVGVYRSFDYGETWVKVPDVYYSFDNLVMSSSGKYMYGYNDSSMYI